MSKKQLTEITGDDLEALRIGTWVLGTGGGGNPFHIALGAKLLAKDTGLKATLIDPMDLDDDANIAFVAFMGAPLINLERLQDYDQGLQPLKVLEQQMGIKIDALLPAEVGGANGMMSFPASMQLGIPVIDADCMGRAYPQFDMITLVVKDEPVPKVVVTDPRGNDVYFPRLSTWSWGERLMRATCAEMGAVGYIACAFKGYQAKRSAIHYTMTKALKIGQAVIKANAENQDPIQAVVAETDGRLFFEGKVIDVERRIEAGFLKGKLLMQGLGKNTSDELLVHFHNEWSVAFLNGKVFITTPDLICLLDTVSGDGVGTDTVRYGQRLSAIAMPIDPIYLTEAGLKAVGPRAFGFDFDYKPFFK